MFAATIWNTAARAHEDIPVERSVVVAPRTEARISDQEVLIAYLGGKVVAFLQRYVDGVPTSGAKVEATIDLVSHDLKEVAPGIYSSGAWPLSAGSNAIDFAFTSGGQKDSATLSLVIASGEDDSVPAKTAPSVAAGAVPTFVLAALAVIIFIGVNGLLLRRPRRV
jgi:hypothetical protein